MSLPKTLGIEGTASRMANALRVNATKTANRVTANRRRTRLPVALGPKC